MTNSKQLSMVKITAIVFFWLFTIVGFLSIPSFVEKFYPQKSITILTWPAFLDAQYLQKFEQETGIKVHLRYVESNEELYVKLKETKGEGYDLIMPSEYMVQMLKQEHILKKIDTSKLTFMHMLYPHLLNNYYDPTNEYAIPFFWSMYGIAYNKEYFNGDIPDPSWALIFDPRVSPGRICMIDGMRELVQIGAQYLFGSADAPFTRDQLEQVQQLLVDQKKLVELYTEDRANFLLASKTSPLAVSIGAVVARIMRTFKNIAFVIPKEGSFLNVDAFVIPRNTQKDDLIYTFLNYLYREDVLKHHIAKYAYFSPVRGIEVDNMPVPMPSQEQIKKASFFKNNISREDLSALWVAVKA
jgi:spermidine/putrescine transport system substrate-binding protein